MIYMIKNVADRRATDLRDPAITNAIRKGVAATIPGANVSIQKEEFEIVNAGYVSNNTLKAMGAAIASESPYLQSIVRTYEYTDKKSGKTKISNQLLKRKA